MPGNLIQIQCNCGYTTILSTGFNFKQDEVGIKSIIMVYSADNKKIINVDSDKANNLQKINDPFVGNKLKQDYLCPECKKNNLEFFKMGHWH